MLSTRDWSKDVETIDSKVYGIIGRAQYHTDGSILIEGLIDIRSIVKDALKGHEATGFGAFYELVNHSNTLLRVPSSAEYIGIESLENNRLKQLVNEAEQFLRENSNFKRKPEKFSTPMIIGKGIIYNYHHDQFLFANVAYNGGRKKIRHIFINYSKDQF